MRLLFLIFFCTTFTYSIYSSGTHSPQELRENALQSVKDLHPSNHLVKWVLKHSKRSIYATLFHRRTSRFLDPFQLKPNLGAASFQASYAAVVTLEIAIKWGRLSESGKESIMEIIDSLIEADRLLAISAVNQAEVLVELGLGNSRHFEKAKQFLERAGIAKKIKKPLFYGKAWSKAHKVANTSKLYISSFEDAPSPFSAQVPNVLEFSFYVFNHSHHHKKHRRNFLKVTQLVYKDGILIYQQESEIEFQRRQKNISGNLSWDGLVNGQNVEDGNYDYVFYGEWFEEKQRKNGSIKLKRKAISLPAQGQFIVDHTAPQILTQITPEANEYGWHSQNVQVIFFSQDEDLAEITAPVQVTTEGITQVKGIAKDHLENESELELEIKLDKTSPVVETTVSPLPNSNGWHKSDVTLSYQVQDNLSGVNNPPANIIYTTEGVFNRSVKVEDFAGNEVLINTALNLDFTFPEISHSFDIQPVGEYGWYNDFPTVTFHGQDSLSGVESISISEHFFNSEGSEQTITSTVTDKATNQNSETITVNIDKSAPDLVITFPQNGDVLEPGIKTFTGTLSDTLSGVNPNKVFLTFSANIYTDIVISTNQWSWTSPSAIQEGVYDLTLAIFDKAENKAEISVSFSVEDSENATPIFFNTITPTANSKPTWSWYSNNGTETFRFRLNNPDLEDPNIVPSPETSFIPLTDLPDGIHTLYIQEKKGNDEWFTKKSFQIIIDTSLQRIPPEPEDQVLIDSLNEMPNTETISSLLEQLTLVASKSLEQEQLNALLAGIDSTRDIVLNFSTNVSQDARNIIDIFHNLIEDDPTKNYLSLNDEQVDIVLNTLNSIIVEDLIDRNYLEKTIEVINSIVVQQTDFNKVNVSYMRIEKFFQSLKNISNHIVEKIKNGTFNSFSSNNGFASVICKSIDFTSQPEIVIGDSNDNIQVKLSNNDLNYNQAIVQMASIDMGPLGLISQNSSREIDNRLYQITTQNGRKIEYKVKVLKN